MPRSRTIVCVELTYCQLLRLTVDSVAKKFRNRFNTSRVSDTARYLTGEYSIKDRKKVL